MPVVIPAKAGIYPNSKFHESKMAIDEYDSNLKKVGFHGSAFSSFLFILATVSGNCSDQEANCNIREELTAAGIMDAIFLLGIAFSFFQQNAPRKEMRMMIIAALCIQKA